MSTDASAANLRLEIFPADLDETLAFYTNVLGFTLTRDDRATEYPYLALERGTIRLGAAARAVDNPDSTLVQRRPPTGVEIVLEVDDLESERNRVEAAGWRVEEDIQQRPWGLRDFRLLDPDGYYLRITVRERA